MRRYFFHILAFCTGEISGVAASFMVLLINNFGLHRLPRVLWFLLHSLNKEVVKGCAFFLILAVIIYTACALVQKDTGKLRLNSRYVISAFAGGLHPLAVTSILLTITNVGLWSRMSSDNQAGTLMGAVFGFLCIVGFLARQFSSEIEPGLGFCHCCGYDLRMLDAARCPECGQPVIEPVQITEIRSDGDLALLERSGFAVVYLQHPEDRLEPEDWVWFVRRFYRRVPERPDAEFYSADVTRAAIRQWLARGSNSAMVSEFDRMALVVKGTVIGASTTQQHRLKALRRSPAHFPNSFKKSPCIGRPSSL